MFGSLARRLTTWYVFVAVSLVVLIVGAVGAIGLLLYGHSVNEAVHGIARQVPDVEQRAREGHLSFAAASDVLQARLKRPGILIRTFPPPPGVPATGKNQGVEYRLVRVDHKSPSGASDKRMRDEIRRRDGGRFGFAAAALLGVHFERAPFMGGVAMIAADPGRMQWVVLGYLLALVPIGVAAGLFAWLVGRYITWQALQPLLAVTTSLQRFAARDFTVQPIDVAGRGEFTELARAYNAAAAQVEAAFAERSLAEGQMRQFVADAGHELRTPLTIVLGYLDVLRRRAADDDRTRRIFETIAIEGSRMRTLIDNLVLLARLEGDEVEPIEPFELTPLLEADIVEPRRGIAPHVRFELDIEVDATIIGDRIEIHEAIANVVDNALKYAPGSPIRIAVRATAGGVEIAVTDCGPGIAPEDRPAIFDRFYRGRMRGEVEGSGLGLAIAKRAVERAGGSLALADTSPAGTTFTIQLRTDQARARAPRRAFA